MNNRHLFSNSIKIFPFEISSILIQHTDALPIQQFPMLLCTIERKLLSPLLSLPTHFYQTQYPLFAAKWRSFIVRMFLFDIFQGRSRENRWMWHSTQLGVYSWSFLSWVYCKPGRILTIIVYRQCSNTTNEWTNKIIKNFPKNLKDNLWIQQHIMPRLTLSNSYVLSLPSSVLHFQFASSLHIMMLNVTRRHNS